MRDTPRLLISAHRGGRDEAPENTVAAFRYAAALGTPGAECDVHLSGDGVPVVIHDDTVDRTTNGTGEIRDLTAAALGALDARATHTDWPEPAGVPTFAEVLAVTREIDYFEVEIKADEPSRIEALVPLLIDAIDGAGRRGKVRFISFDPDACALCHRLAPDMMLSLLVNETTDVEIAQALELGCDGIAGDVKTATEGFVAAAHERGLTVTIWTVNEDTDFDNMLAWGVDVVTTDRPRHMLARLAANTAVSSA
jgi:glycerophosphoryl diester phosphodiesterase